MYYPVLAVVLAIMLSGCTTQGLKYLEAPEVLSVSGQYVHESSGVMFPVTVGDFARSGISKFDQDAQDVGISYQTADSAKYIKATVYVYPSPPLKSIGSPKSVIEEARAYLCDQEFEQTVQFILNAQSDSSLIEKSGEVSSQAPHFLRVQYTGDFASVSLPLNSELEMSCYLNDKWNLKFRFTYPADLEIAPKLQEFKANFVKQF